MLTFHRMKESDNQQRQSHRRIVNDKEHHKIFIEENLQEGYTLAAKMKKTSERSRSLSLKLNFKENLKHNENVSGCKGKVRVFGIGVKTYCDIDWTEQ